VPRLHTASAARAAGRAPRPTHSAHGETLRRIASPRTYARPAPPSTRWLQSPGGGAPQETTPRPCGGGPRRSSGASGQVRVRGRHRPACPWPLPPPEVPSQGRQVCVRRGTAGKERAGGRGRGRARLGVVLQGLDETRSPTARRPRVACVAGTRRRRPAPHRAQFASAHVPPVGPWSRRAAHCAARLRGRMNVPLRPPASVPAQIRESRSRPQNDVGGKASLTGPPPAARRPPAPPRAAPSRARPPPAPF
jgi:hypothetical protein